MNCVKKRILVFCVFENWYDKIFVEFIYCVILFDFIGFLYNVFVWVFFFIIYLFIMNGYFSCLMYLIMKFKMIIVEYFFK